VNRRRRREEPHRGGLVDTVLGSLTLLDRRVVLVVDLLASVAAFPDLVVAVVLADCGKVGPGSSDGAVGAGGA
jgi:hypothetical protein